MTPTPADVGEPKALGPVEEAQAPTGAINATLRARRTGRRAFPPQRSLGGHYGWVIETTFVEMRGYLKLEKTRGRTEKTVLRTGPCLFGRYAVIALGYADLPARWQHQRAVAHGRKQGVAFAEAITAVRRWLWSEWVFATPGHKDAFAKIPAALRQALLRGLAPTA